MSVSPTVLLITLAVGVPLMLLALGVLYHAYLFSQQPMETLEQHVDSLATESAEELLFALQEAVDEMQEQLAHQREALAGMLSEKPQPAFATVAPLSLDHHFDLAEAERPTAAGEFVPRTDSRVEPRAMARGGSDVRTRIAELADEGLSDRAIARELHIGLEEVRIARMLGRQS
ncbi:MAG: hypothetical protein AB7F65_08955 [Dehalococcoidia bacterium]